MTEGIPNFRWCLRGGCISGQIHDSGDSNPMMICATCSYAMCYTHQQPWHSGKTCRQVDQQRDGEESFREDKASEEKIKELTKPCPKCQKPIEKIKDTCHHMTCRPPVGCGHEFCYDCLEPWHGYGTRTRHKSDCISKPSADV
jgi:IBR domain, a half RING-finger domain